MLKLIIFFSIIKLKEVERRGFILKKITHSCVIISLCSNMSMHKQHLCTKCIQDS